MMLTVLSFAFALTQAGSAAAADPLAQAKAGKVQCYAPDTARKTCRSIASYAVRPDGKFDNKAVVAISPQPFITLETVTSVEVRNGAVCGFIRPEDLASSVLKLDGKPAPEGQAAPLRDAIAQGFQPFYGRELCTTYVSQGAGWIAQATVGGQRVAEMDQQVIWISPADGYQVAP